MASSRSSADPGHEGAAAFHARLNGIDAFRFLAIVGVVLMHASNQGNLGVLLDLASRWAVPFFFIVAGYFVGLKKDLSFTATVAHVLKRILLPYAIWLAAYLVYFRYYPQPPSFRRHIFELVAYGGPAFHLWFLPSLALCTVMLALARRLFPLWAIVAAAILLYATGLALGPYARFVFPGQHPEFDPRNGPFLGFPFMVLGYALRRRPAAPGSFGLGIALYAVGFVLAVGEVLGLKTVPGKVRFDLLLAVVPMGLGMFMAALHMPWDAALRPLARLGRYSLGLFAVHLFALLELQTLFPGSTVTAELMVATGTLLAAVAISVLLGRFRLTRPLVR